MIQESLYNKTVFTEKVKLRELILILLLNLDYRLLFLEDVFPCA